MVDAWTLVMLLVTAALAVWVAIMMRMLKPTRRV